MNPTEYFENLPHDPNDPNPWQALFLDKSIPFDDTAKASFLYDQASKSRQFALPLIRPLARLSIVVIQIVKVFTPRKLSSPRFLHRLLFYAMKYFITPEANYLIFRHFNLGSEILQVIRDNISGIEVPVNPLKPVRFADVKNNLFLLHDLNLFNFIIRLNKDLKEKNITIKPVPHSQLNLGCVTTDGFKFQQFRNGWTNVFDLSSAIEIFTPVYQLFLTDNDSAINIQFQLMNKPSC